MKKVLFLFFAIILIAGGLYGTNYFLRLQKAESLINEAIINIKEGNYDKSINLLKDTISRYDYRIVIAPALYILADTYEKKEMYTSAIAMYKILISESRLSSIQNWYVQSIISMSKLHRKGLVKTSAYQTDVLEDYINTISKEIRKKREQDQIGLSRVIKKINQFINLLLSLNFHIDVEDVDNEKILTEMETELGFLYLKTKDYDRAKDAFMKLDTTVSKFGLAQVYLESGKYNEGINILEELIKYDTTGKVRKYYVKELFEYAENLYKNKKYKEAIGLFIKVENEAKDTTYSEMSLYYLAKYYHNINNTEKALIYIQKMLENSIILKDEESLLLKGYIYYDRRDFIKALKIFNDFIKNYPDSERINTAREWKTMSERSIKYLG